MSNIGQSKFGNRPQMFVENKDNFEIVEEKYTQQEEGGGHSLKLDPKKSPMKEGQCEVCCFKEVKMSAPVFL